MKRPFILTASTLLIISGFLAVANAQDDKGTWAMKKSGWLMLTPAERGQVHDFAEDYKNYLTVARTAQSSTREVLRRARAAGFAEFTDASQIKPGARLIFPNRDRALILAVIGTEPMVDASHVVGTHHDSPHIDLKGRPIFPAGGFALLKTIY
jgi:aspartyl aminopeptidase